MYPSLLLLALPLRDALDLPGGLARIEDLFPFFLSVLLHHCLLDLPALGAQRHGIPPSRSNRHYDYRRGVEELKPPTVPVVNMDFSGDGHFALVDDTGIGAGGPAGVVGVTGVAVLPHGGVGGAFAHHDALVGGDVELEGAGIVLVSLVVNLNLGQVVALEEFVDVGLIVDGTEPAGAAAVEVGAVAV